MSNEVKYDKRHGSPYDRGSADAWYGRGWNPHYYEGGTHVTPIVEVDDMTEEEVSAYNAGYNSVLEIEISALKG